MLGLLLGLAGVALLVWPRESAPSGHFGWQSLVLVGGLSWAVGTIVYRNAALPIGPIAFNAVMMLLGGTWLVARRRSRPGSCRDWQLGAARPAGARLSRGVRLGARVHRVHVAAEARAAPTVSARSPT